MATNVAGVLNIVIKNTRTITGGSLSIPTDQGVFTWPNTTYANGTAVAQLEEAWHGQVIVVGTNITTLDLAGSGLVIQGSTVTFTTVKEFAAYNPSTNVADIISMGGGASAWETWAGASGDVVKILPGGVHLMATKGHVGFAVTAGSADQLRFVNVATNTVTLDVMIAGNKT